MPAWTPESSVETPVPRYPLTDDDALDEPTAVERFGPLPASRPSLVERLREKVALRRALRVAALDEREDGVEIVSGPDAPSRAPRSRADLARRRDAALRPASGPGSVAGDDEESPAAAAALEAALEEQPTPPLRPAGAGGGSGARPAPGPAPGAGAGEDGSARSPGPGRARARGPASEEVPAVAEAGPRTVDGRRLSAVLGAAIVLMFIVGVASARSTTPLPVTSEQPTPTAAAPQRQVVVSPSVQASAPPVQSAHPGQPLQSARPAPPPPASPPAAGLPALTGAVTVGEGAPGWSVQDIRYGAHPGYLRMVFDLEPAAGTATGSPRVTIGFQDPTTLLVSLDQVTARSAPAAPLGGGVVASVSLLQPPPATGSVAYVVKLSRPVQFTPAFASSPLRLILDLR